MARPVQVKSNANFAGASTSICPPCNCVCQCLPCNATTTQPVEFKPPETKPLEIKPPETKPLEIKPTETKPLEIKPTETKPPTAATYIESGPLYPNFCQEHSRTAVSADRARWLRRGNAPVIHSDARFPQNCSSTFASSQLEMYQRHFRSPHLPQMGPLYCIDINDFLTHYHSIDPDPNKVIFDIGANKGYFSVNVYAVFTNFSTNTAWMTHHLTPGCPWYADVDKHVFPEIHAFEPGLGSFQMLKKLQATLPMCGFHPVHAGVSDIPGTTTIANAKPGDEQVRLGSAPTDGGAASTTTVPVITVDNYSQEKNILHIDIVSIDTETYDPYVIRGMKRMLAQGSIDVVCFEMNDVKIAPELRPIVTQFEQYAYDCFIMGPSLLIKISDKCWNDAYPTSVTQNGFNVLCVRRSYEFFHQLTAPFRYDKWNRDALW